MEGDMKPYCDLDSLGKKARRANGRINCEKCPMHARCTDMVMEVCAYVFEHGYRAGYNQRKREEKCKKS